MDVYCVVVAFEVKTNEIMMISEKNKTFIHAL